MTKMKKSRTLMVVGPMNTREQRVPKASSSKSQGRAIAGERQPAIALDSGIR